MCIALAEAPSKFTLKVLFKTNMNFAVNAVAQNKQSLVGWWCFECKILPEQWNQHNKSIVMWNKDHKHVSQMRKKEGHKMPVYRKSMRLARAFVHSLDSKTCLKWQLHCWRRNDCIITVDRRLINICSTEFLNESVTFHWMHTYTNNTKLRIRCLL